VVEISCNREFVQMLTVLLFIQLPRLRGTDTNRDEEINLLCVF
jgi:hypothetical protein